MPELSATPQGNLPEYTVSELSRALKRTVEDAYERVRVRGEISGFKRAGSGHLYMSLKDSDAVLDAVCWRSTAGRLSVQPEDGLEVVAIGRLTTYAARSKYQLVVEALELAGEGALLKLLEERRRRLAAEGLFDEARKMPLPFLPEVIGVVTSPTGAVIRDILHRLADRFPRRVLLWPVLVQGEGAAEQIAAAIEGFNRLAPDGPVPRPDLLIVARGGGSLEDLWAFNEEVVVRAAASSRIPLISAVGHETDWTLIDHAADRRAPTPTAAAEMAVPVRTELVAQVLDDGRRMIAAMGRLVQERRLRLEGLGRGLPDVTAILGTHAQRLDGAVERLANAIAVRRERWVREVEALGHRVRSPVYVLRTAEERVTREATALRNAVERRRTDAEARLLHLADLLESVSFRRVLERGYAVVRDAADKVVSTADSVRPGDKVSIEFADGRRPALIGGQGGAVPPARRRRRSRDDRQGDLL